MKSKTFQNNLNSKLKLLPLIVVSRLIISVLPYYIFYRVYISQTSVCEFNVLSELGDINIKSQVLQTEFPIK